MHYQFKKYVQPELLKHHLHMGGENPQGESIEVTSQYLERGGKPWIGVMGEMHFARCKREAWHEELCKMKAGGITIVATYMFWIYHEEQEGIFDFTGDLDIRAFVQECNKLGLDVLLRIGPWAHGECRNGGFPDWLFKKPYKLRDNNDDYMKQAYKWYARIYEQIQGLLYKDGGNIIGIQLENELTDQPEHLLALKKLAQKIGFEVPLYTVTGWNRLLGAKIPSEEVMPVFGAYPDAPWADGVEKLPLSTNYVFDAMRNDCAIGVDLIAKTEKDDWRLPYEWYPFATCELGGGMQVTHHRRPLITGMDAYALALTKLGSGNNLPGYYMYHGGTNKIGQLSTFNENKASGYPNDYAILSYDFQAPISEYGEIREQYRLLNILHLFINDFGDILAPMSMTEAENNPKTDNLSDLRYAMRSDGQSGFVFINHYQRLAKLEDVYNVAIDTGSIVFPDICVKGDNSFFMPFSMNLEGNILEYATVQPLCRVGNTFFFMEIDGIQPIYQFQKEPPIKIENDENRSFSINNIFCVTLTKEQARFARKIGNTLMIGKECDIYESDGIIKSVEAGEFTYDKWTGLKFETCYISQHIEQAQITFEDLEQAPMVPTYPEELHLGGTRKLIWKKIEVTSAEGMVEIPFSCDTEQIYADGQLVADNFYYGVAWRVPASLLYQKTCYLVLSEMKDDFYREF